MSGLRDEGRDARLILGDPAHTPGYAAPFPAGLTEIDQTGAHGMQRHYVKGI